MPADKRKRSVLITGCSDGGLGSALAVAFHEAGFHVYATARTISKMKRLSALGIETKELDVLSDSSIAKCVADIPDLDILVNNAGLTMTMTSTDTPMAEAKKIFDVNLWAVVALTQAFAPSLVRSKGMIVNHSSLASVIRMPLGAVYGASKAAIAQYSAIMRIELEPLGVRVVDLKTGVVGPTNLEVNKTKVDSAGSEDVLPKTSIFQPAKEVIGALIHRDYFQDEAGQSGMTPPDKWAKLVVQDLKKPNPPFIIWQGAYVFLGKLAAYLPMGWIDNMTKKAAKWDQVEAVLSKTGTKLKPS